MFYVSTAYAPSEVAVINMQFYKEKCFLLNIMVREINLDYNQLKNFLAIKSFYILVNCLLP